jgi:uncharacterized membrane protein YvlD (DUF360 family)
MGGYFKNLLLLLLIFFFTTTIFTGIVMPIISLYFIATLVVLSIGIMLTRPLLGFLTIKVNFLTYLLMSSIITVGITFLLRIFMTGFFVENSYFNGASFDFLEINSFELNPILTIVLFGVVSAFISTLFYVLDKSD